MRNFSGLGLNLGNLSHLSDAQTRSISAENFSGEKGKGGMATEGTGASCARDLGQGWKVSPSIEVPLPDFFALPWGPLFIRTVRVNSLPVVVAPQSGLNCFWEMPFQKKCKITLQNIDPTQDRVPIFPDRNALEIV